MEELKRDADKRKENEQIDLLRLAGDVVKYLRRFWWLALILTGGGAFGLYAFQTIYYEPMYECTATFTVATDESGSGSYSFYYDASTADQLSKTFPYILESSFFQNVLLEELGTDTLNGTIEAETISGSNVVTMKGKSSDPDQARAILEAAIEIYPETAHFVLGNIQFEMLDEPVTPGEPYNQYGLKKSLAVGGCGGLFVTFLFFGLLSLFRKNISDIEDMKKITSLRCLAVLPGVKFKARKKSADLRLSMTNDRLPYEYKESMRSLAVRVVKSMEKSRGGVLLVTSTLSGEGKSVTALNLAQTLAAEDFRVLLIDGDLRKQGDARMAGAKGDYGLIQVARGVEPPEEELRADGGIGFIGEMRGTKQPAAVLSSVRVKEFIEERKKTADYIIIDSPPCQLFHDAGILAEYADGILYVVRQDQVSGQKVREGIQFLRRRKAEFIGYVLNDCRESGMSYRYGKYGYGKYGYGKYGYGKYGYKKNYGGTPEQKEPVLSAGKGHRQKKGEAS